MAYVSLPCPECGQKVTWETWRDEHPFMTMCCGAIVRLQPGADGYVLSTVELERVPRDQAISPESHE